MEAPRRIGRFEVIRELASGGMGVVYLARDPDLDREVALKLLRPTIGALADLERFEVEAQATARLHHPAIVGIHEVGRDAGRAYIVMELVEGMTLKERLREGPLEPDEAVEVCATLARAVQHAHDNGILHRDIKPANVLLTRDGSPKLSDFGLARDLCAERERLTRSGEILGTPAYMPPEQANGDLERIDARADVYGLGALLYHCLTGVPPFRGGALQIIRSVLLDAPTRPTKLQPAVPPDLEQVRLRAMAKRPEDRFSTAASLAEHLSGSRPGAPAGQPARLVWLAVLAILIAGAVLFGVGSSEDVIEPESVESSADAPTSTSSKPQDPKPPQRLTLPPAPTQHDFPRVSPQLWKLAEGGDVDAMTQLGRRLALKEHRQAARYWFLRAAQADSQRAVISLLRFETEPTPPWLQALAEQGHRTAMREMGRREPNPARGVTWFEKGARAGDRESMAILADRLFEGKGVEQNKVLARKWYVTAAKLGDRHAMLVAARMLVKGWGGPPDPDQGREWYEELLSTLEKPGHPAALEPLLSLGELYRAGTPKKPPAPAQARELFLRAAELQATHGREHQTNIAIELLQGRTGQRDPALARKLLERPAAQGEPRALFHLGLLLVETSSKPGAGTPAASIDLGARYRESGLRVVHSDPGRDGRTEALTLGGRSARRSKRYIYLAVGDGLPLRGEWNELWITVDYWDDLGWVGLQYDARSTAYKLCQPRIELGGTRAWRRHTFHVIDARLSGRQNSMASLRIVNGRGDPVTVARVELSFTGGPDDALRGRMLLRRAATAQLGNQDHWRRVYMARQLLGGAPAAQDHVLALRLLRSANPTGDSDPRWMRVAIGRLLARVQGAREADLKRSQALLARARSDPPPTSAGQGSGWTLIRMARLLLEAPGPQDVAHARALLRSAEARPAWRDEARRLLAAIPE